MFYNKVNLSKIILLLGLLFLTACANKQAIVESDPSTLQAQKEQEQFNYALGLIQTENAQEENLLKAKDILDALYKSNAAYLGALINSADISLKLKKLDEAKSLYLLVIEKIEQQKAEASDETLKDEQASSVISEHVIMFTIHTYNQLGLIERQQGQFGQAETYYRQALALDSDNSVSIKNLAILLDLYRGKLAEALALYEQYQKIADGSDSQITDPKIKDWIYDLKNRLPAEDVGNE